MGAPRTADRSSLFWERDGLMAAPPAAADHRTATQGGHTGISLVDLSRDLDQLHALEHDQGELVNVAPGSVKVFVTVGTELPFDRLVHIVDAWAVKTGCADGVFAQIGENADAPKHIRWARFVDKPQFDEIFDSAEVVVSHAGMGTILSALDRQRKLLVMPRRASLGEHRNDHQLATTNRLGKLGRVDCVLDEDELVERLDDLRTISAKPQISHYAQQSLIDALRSSIEVGTRRKRSRRGRSGPVSYLVSRITARWSHGISHRIFSG